MPYQELKLARLKTTPFPEADYVRQSSGIDFPTPTLVEANEGNRRLFRESGIELLVILERRLHRSGIVLAPEFHLVVAMQGLRGEARLRNLVHEAGHALSAYLRDFRPRPGYFKWSDLDNGDEAPITREEMINERKISTANRLVEEGFAEYWEDEAIATHVLGLSGQEAEARHRQTIGKQLKIIEDEPLDMDTDARYATYPLGHTMMLYLMKHLPPVVGRQEAIKMIANSDPDSLDKVLSAARGKYPSFLGLSWRQQANYRARQLIAKG
jgi:hypothetical protein